MGENVTFVCSTSNSFVIWEVSFTDRSIRHIFRASDRLGRSFTESTHGLQLHFHLTSNANGVLESTLWVITSTLLENALIECEGTVTHSLTFRLACKYCKI